MRMEQIVQGVATKIAIEQNFATLSSSRAHTLDYARNILARLPLTARTRPAAFMCEQLVQRWLAQAPGASKSETAVPCSSATCRGMKLLETMSPRQRAVPDCSNGIGQEHRIDRFPHAWENADCKTQLQIVGTRGY